MDHETAFRKYSRQIFVTALGYLKDRSEAENVLQDVFVKLLTCRREFESDEHLRNWLLKVAVNLSKNILRSPRFRRTDSLEWESAETAVPQADRAAVLDVRNAVLSLEPTYRLPVLLFYYDGLGAKDAARVMGISENAFKVRLHRAREMLRTVLGDDYDYEIQ